MYAERYYAIQYKLRSKATLENNKLRCFTVFTALLVSQHQNRETAIILLFSKLPGISAHFCSSGLYFIVYIHYQEVCYET